MTSLRAFIVSLESCIIDCTPAPDDQIIGCFDNGFPVVRNLLRNSPDEALRLADEKLRVFPYKDVKDCWKRLFVDASIVKACQIIQRLLCDRASSGGEEYDQKRQDGEVHGAEEEVKLKADDVLKADHIDPDSPWLDMAVCVLDNALILAGGFGRTEVISSLFDALAGSTAPRLNIEGQADESDVMFPTSFIPVPIITRPIPRISSSELSFELFTTHVNFQRSPLVITGAIKHWPASSSWSSRKFWMDRTFDGRRLVPVEVGRSYTDEGWGQKIMPFGDFAGVHLWGSCDHAHCPSDTEVAGEEDESVVETGYLAQHDLLAQIPALRNDIAIPDYCYVDAPPPEPGTPLYEK
ncbi:hypothetical protein KEM54_004058, partial [Ascosphaera aggregata]